MIPQPNLLFLELPPPPPFAHSDPHLHLCSLHILLTFPNILFLSTLYVTHFSTICCSLCISPQYIFSHVLLCALSPALFLNPSDPARLLKNVLSSLSNHNSNLFSYFLLYFSSVLLFLMFHHLLRLSPIPFSYCCLYFHLQSP